METKLLCPGCGYIRNVNLEEFIAKQERAAKEAHKIGILSDGAYQKYMEHHNINRIKQQLNERDYLICRCDQCEEKELLNNLLDSVESDGRGGFNFDSTS